MSYKLTYFVVAAVLVLDGYRLKYKKKLIIIRTFFIEKLSNTWIENIRFKLS